MSPSIEKVIEAARAGGDILERYFGQSLETMQKTTAADFVTKADTESEKAILDALTAAFPEYALHSEERGEIRKDSPFTFFVDPLDGTNNFVLGIPNFSISIGLLREKKIILGVIYAPVINALYWAEEGSGAYRDGTRLSVNKNADIRNATICLSCDYDTPFEKELGVVHRLYSREAKRVMSNWSPALDLCLLASGRIEAMVSMGNELYDFAAGKIIAKEASAALTDLNGNPETNDENRLFIASNGTQIHRQLVKTVNKEILRTISPTA